MLLLGGLFSKRQSVARMPLTNQGHPLLFHPQGGFWPDDFSLVVPETVMPELD